MNELRQELAIKTTILRLVIAVQFSMLVPKIVYTQHTGSGGAPAEATHEKTMRGN